MGFKAYLIMCIGNLALAVRLHSNEWTISLSPGISMEISPELPKVVKAKVFWSEFTEISNSSPVRSEKANVFYKITLRAKIAFFSRNSVEFDG